MNTARETPSYATPQQYEGPETDWMNYAEAAVAMGCSTKTLQRRVKAGEIVPYIRYGSKQYWFKSEDVVRLVIGG
jgi:excisionase family DNA binding protein